MSLWNFSINTPLGLLYQEALQLDEYATKSFWAHFLKHKIFPGEEWVISPERPPRDHHSQRRIDLVVRHFAGPGFRILLFIEGKKGRAAPSDIAEVETQAYSAAQEYLLDKTGIMAVWAMTVYGPHARFWFCPRGDSGFLEPLLPARNYAYGERSSYLDVSTNQEDFKDTFDLIIANPVPDSDLIEHIMEEKDDAEEMEEAEEPDQGSSSIVPINENDMHVVIDKIRDDHLNCIVSSTGSSVKLGRQWIRSSVFWENEPFARECFVHTQPNGQRYWTWDLQGREKGKGHGKGKRSK